VGAFRSPQEFFLHARWLIMGADMDPERFPDCGCKYCGKRVQKDIDREYQLPGRNGSSHPGQHSGRPGGSSLATTSGAIIQQAKDYRNLKKPTTGYGLQFLSFSSITFSLMIAHQAPGNNLQRCREHRPSFATMTGGVCESANVGLYFSEIG